MARGAHSETRRQRRARLQRERRAAARASARAPSSQERAPGMDGQPGRGWEPYRGTGEARGPGRPEPATLGFASHALEPHALETDEAETHEVTDDLPADHDGGGDRGAVARSWTGEPITRRRGGGLALALLLGVLAALVALVATTVLLDGQATTESAIRGPVMAGEGVEQATLLLIRRDGEGAPADGLTLLATGPQEDSGLVLFLPVGTLIDIPGVGLDRLGLTHQYGGPVLTQAAVENLLGIEIDHLATVSDAGLGSLLSRTGGFGVEVGSRLVERADDGTAEVRFEAGEQILDGRRLAEYWGFISRGEDELVSFSRQQAVLRGLLEQIRESDAFDVVFGDGAPQLDTDADADWVRAHMRTLAAAHDENRLRVTMLPVESFGGAGPDGGATFRPRREELETLVSEALAASVPADGVGGAVRVQVLNGVGVPGIGQVVDRRLGGGSFRIVLTDNARSFDFTETRILVYDETARSMEAGRRVRERLGVGTIQVSRQPQSVVDVTIVVGSDFLEAEGIVPEAGEDETDDEPSE